LDEALEEGVSGGRPFSAFVGLDFSALFTLVVFFVAMILLLLGSRTSRVATVAMRVRKAQLPLGRTDLKPTPSGFSRIFLRSMFQSILDQASPKAPLLIPGQGAGDRLQLGQPNRVATPAGWGQEQDLLLDIRGQNEQVHDLSNASSAHAAELGQLAVVGDTAGAYEVFHADSQGHQASDARNSAGFRGKAISSAAPGKVQVALNCQ